jgi:small subunit ribosomal protein S3Ae
MIDIVEEAAKERTYEQLVDSVVEGRLSSAIYGEAKVIYPLRRVEVQKLTLEARPEEVEAEEEAAVDVDADEVAVDED